MKSLLANLSRVALIATALLGGCQTYISRTILPQGERPPEFAVDVERDIAMLTSDGIALVANVYRPKTNSRVPTILVRIPFTQSFKNNLGVDAVGRFWGSRGYNVVIQGTRGRFKSGGNFYPLVHER